MTYSEKHLDQIDDYLRQPDRNGHPPSLSQELEQDPDLKAAFQDVEMLWQATRLERLQGKLDMLKKYEGEIKAEAQAQAEERPARIISMNRRRILSIAAGILLIAVVGWFLFRPQEPLVMQHAYLAEHFDEYIMHDVLKGDDLTPYTNEQLQAYNLFMIKEFERAIPMLKELWTTRQDTLALFYHITILYGMGEGTIAEDLLTEGESVLTQRQMELLRRLRSEK